MLNLFTATVISLLIFVGLMYITVYEKAPISERLQVFGVVMGLNAGILLLLC